MTTLFLTDKPLHEEYEGSFEDQLSEALSISLTLTQEFGELRESLLMDDYTLINLSESQTTQKSSVLDKIIEKLIAFINNVKNKAITFFTKISMYFKQLMLKLTGRDIVAPDGTEAALKEMIEVLEEIKTLEEAAVEPSKFVKAYTFVKNKAKALLNLMYALTKKAMVVIKNAPKFLNALNILVLVSAAMAAQYKANMEKAQIDAETLRLQKLADKGELTKEERRKANEDLQNLDKRIKGYADLIKVVGTLSAGLSQLLFKNVKTTKAPTTP